MVWRCFFFLFHLQWLCVFGLLARDSCAQMATLFLGVSLATSILGLMYFIRNGISTRKDIFSPRFVLLLTSSLKFYRPDVLRDALSLIKKHFLGGGEGKDVLISFPFHYQLASYFKIPPGTNS